jgi:hypothetical protein
MRSSLRRSLRRALLTSMLVAMPLATFTSLALADDIYNTLDEVVNASPETMNIPLGQTSGTSFKVNVKGGDGCDIASGKLVRFNIQSSNASVATVSPSQITFDNDCTDAPAVTVSGLAIGSSSITLVQAENTTGKSFNVDTARFTVNVTSTNTKPSVALNGVTSGASYRYGSVPAATCAVTDAEDGNSTFAATLSAVTGPASAFGLGSQTASCDYTDRGGLAATPVSATYSIIDASAPVVTKVVTPATPDGTEGWYRGNVSLAWTVTDPESTVTSTTGCAPQSITADQTAVSYGCSATSTGGTTSDSVTLKRDGTQPFVTPTTPAAPDSGWFLDDVSIGWACGDSTSGLLAACPATTTIAGEGSGLTSSVTATDHAGNARTGTSDSVNIDRTNPTLSVVLRGTKSDYDWYRSVVDVDWTCSDSPSGFATTNACPDQTFGEGAGQSSTKTVQDRAGRSTTVGTGLVDVDLTPPDGAPSVPAAIADGWYDGDVTVTWNCSDALSGLVPNACPSTTITGEGEGLRADKTAEDKAGNTTALSKTGIKIDRTAPFISVSLDKVANDAGWFNSPVHVDWTCTDTGGSGVVESCDDQDLVEGEAQPVSKTIHDKVGHENSDSLEDVNIDTTAPTGSPTTLPDPNENGWYTDDVTVAWNCVETLSGLVPHACDDLIVLGEGSNLGGSRVVSDVAGNSTTLRVAGIHIDRTKPTLSGAPLGGPNAKGWYNSAVTIDWTCTDGGSGLADDACPNTTISGDGEGLTDSHSVTDAAGLTTEATSAPAVNIDATKPTGTGAATTAANDNGWYNSDVTIDWTCTDNLSGIVTGGCADTTITGEGRGLGSSTDATDEADNSRTLAVSGFNIDRTAPLVDGIVTTPSFSSGGTTWYRDAAHADFSASDPNLADHSAGSGVTSGPSPSGTTFGEGRGQSASSSASDAAGNTGTGWVTGVNVDASAPNLDVSITSTPAYGAWYKDSVSISVTASDPDLADGSAGSGVDTASTVRTGSTSSSDTTTVTAYDQVGHSATRSVSYLVDATKPSFTSECPTTLALGQTATVTARDELFGSGLAATGNVLSYTATGGIGPKTVNFTAYDNVGHSNMLACTISQTYNWTGFFQPIDNLDATGKEILNKVKAGSTVPVKFSLKGDQGPYVLATGAPTSKQIACSLSAVSDPMEYTTAATSGLKYDATADQYIYNWKTGSWAGTCRQLIVTLADGSVHTASFQFTK